MAVKYPGPKARGLHLINKAAFPPPAFKQGPPRRFVDELRGRNGGSIMPIEEGGERYLSTQEARELLGISGNALRELRKEYHLQLFTIVGQGKVLFYRETDLKKIPRVRPVQSDGDAL
jgi:hypothetical protein